MITIPVITERCASIDVGKRGLAVAAALGPADKEAEIRTRAYGTTVPALLKAWLVEQGCTSVAMESTGSYWIPVKNILPRRVPDYFVMRAQTTPQERRQNQF
jgi:transposase